MTTATGAPPHHNTITCYTDYRCRQPECVARYNAHERARRSAQRAGTWQGLVDAKPVRQHIVRLHAAGIGTYGIAAAANVQVQCIDDFLQPRGTRGRKHRTSPETAAKILAVTPDTITAGRVDATGTIRRAQALIAIGWPKRTISLRAGLGNAYLSQLFDRTHIYASAAQAIAKTYDELRRQRPEKHGVSKGLARRCRDTATARHWPTPKYWDQFPDRLDDPDFVPEATRAEQIAHDAAWLLESGHTPEQAAHRLGVTRRHFERCISESGQETAA